MLLLMLNQFHTDSSGFNGRRNGGKADIWRGGGVNHLKFEQEFTEGVNGGSTPDLWGEEEEELP